jgi:CubicO group peptidase (beta-lactamase class C family)
MIHPDITKDYAAALKDFPDQTQLAISLYKKGKTEYVGLRKDQAGIHPSDNADFAFEIGSVTKAFTGNVLAQLVLEEKVGPDDAIQPFLPFQLLDNPPITLKHLAQHVSGIQRLPHNFFELPDYLPENPYLHSSEKDFAHYFSTLLRLDSPPGEKFQYTNLGMSLLSYIISRIEGKTFPIIVSERIFKPLGMTHSAYDPHALTVPVIPGIDENGKYCSHWDAGIYAGSLGILSTAGDLMAFARWQLDRTSSACQYQANEHFVIDATFKSLMGWNENGFTPQDIRIRSINGGTGGYGASLMVNPDADMALVVLSNAYPYHYLDKIVPLNKQVMLQHA